MSQEDSNATSPINDENTLKQSGVPSEFLLMQPGEKLQLIASLKFQMKDFKGSLKCYETLIEKDSDEWSHHMGYFDSLFALSDEQQREGGEDKEFKSSCIAEQAVRFSELQARSPRARTPYLVEMNFLQRLVRDGSHASFPDPIGVLGDLVLK
jgi:hypothetical protein